MLLSSFDETELLPLDYRYAQSSIQSGQDTVNELQMRSQQLGSQDGDSKSRWLKRGYYL
jgi:hypothetical protein